MEWLNYHHLLYFWTIVRKGGLVKAANELGLAPSTVSAQIRLLETTLGYKLFERVGRRLVLTDVGRIVSNYAEDIFTLGRELMSELKGATVGRPLLLKVGVADVVPKLVAQILLEPVMSLPGEARILCREDRPDKLLAELALHHLPLRERPALPGPRHVRRVRGALPGWRPGLHGLPRSGA